MNDDKLNQLIAKYLAGQCAPSEKQEVERWYDQYDAGDKKYRNDDTEEMQASAKRSFEELSKRHRNDMSFCLSTANVGAVIIICRLKY